MTKIYSRIKVLSHASIFCGLCSMMLNSNFAYSQNSVTKNSKEEVNPYANEQVYDDARNPRPHSPTDTTDAGITNEVSSDDAPDFLSGSWHANDVIMKEAKSVLTPSLSLFELRFTDSKTVVFRLNEFLPQQKGSWESDGDLISIQARILMGCHDCARFIRLENVILGTGIIQADFIIENDLGERASGSIKCVK